MPRSLRYSYPRAVHHIVCRTNSGQALFLDDQDRQRFLDNLRRYKTKFDFFLFAYVLMPNHAHLLIQVNSTPLSKVMHGLNTAYAVYFNKKWSLHGHLLQGRFYSSLVEKESYLREVSRYIHLNPVRAELVSTPESWRWSSCRAYLGLEKNDLVDMEKVRQLEPFINSDQYREFLNAGINKQLPVKIRNGVWFIGGQRFINDVSRRLKIYGK